MSRRGWNTTAETPLSAAPKAAPRRLAWAAVLVAIASAPAAGQAAVDPSAPGGMDETLVAVDGQPVRRGDFAEWLLRLHGPNLWSDFLDHQIVARAAARHGVELAPGEVADQVEREWRTVVRMRFDGDEEGYVRELAGYGYTPESYRRSREVTLGHERRLHHLAARRRDTSDEAIARRFEELFGATPVRVQARTLSLERRRLLRDPSRLPAGARPSSFAEIDAIARELAGTLAERARAGEAFQDLARRYSDDERADDGGRIDPYGAEGVAPEVEAALAGLAPGEVSAPFATPVGWAIAMLEARDPVTLDEARDEVRRAILEAPADAAELAATLATCREEIDVGPPATPGDDSRPR